MQSSVGPSLSLKGVLPTLLLAAAFQIGILGANCASTSTLFDFRSYGGFTGFNPEHTSTPFYTVAPLSPVSSDPAYSFTIADGGLVITGGTTIFDGAYIEWNFTLNGVSDLYPMGPSFTIMGPVEADVVIEARMADSSGAFVKVGETLKVAPSTHKDALNVRFGGTVLAKKNAVFSVRTYLAFPKGGSLKAVYLMMGFLMYTHTPPSPSGPPPPPPSPPLPIPSPPLPRPPLPPPPPGPRRAPVRVVAPAPATADSPPSPIGPEPVYLDCPPPSNSTSSSTYRGCYTANSGTGTMLRVEGFAPATPELSRCACAAEADGRGLRFFALARDPMRPSGAECLLSGNLDSATRFGQSASCTDCGYAWNVNPYWERDVCGEYNSIALYDRAIEKAGISWAAPVPSVVNLCVRR
eukprot:tig00020723_g13493.t1